jgi:hypothetical protein
MFTRRRFLVGMLPLAAALSGGLTYLGYRKGGCPLSSQATCQGPCTAFLDRGDGLCLRLPAIVASEASAEALSDSAAPPTAGGSEAGATATAVTTGGVVASGEFAEATPTPAAPDVAANQKPPPSATPQPAPTPLATVRTQCPFGLVDDPYPGRCKRYIDKNGNGYCDLSEQVTAP